MALRKKTDKRVTSISTFVTFAFYAIIVAVFWQVGGKEVVKDFVVKMTDSKRPPPPPPPKREPPKLQMKQPPKIRPSFQVTQPKFASSSVRPDFGKAVIPVFDREGDMSDVTRMAKMYDMGDIARNMSAGKSASLDIGSKFGFGLGDVAGGQSMVVGAGKRIRATITLAIYGKQFMLESRRTLRGIQQHLAEETSIKVSPSVKQIEWEETFDLWYKNNVEKSITASGTEMDLEREGISRLGQAVSQLANDPVGGRQPFVQDVKNCWQSYLRKRFPAIVEALGISKASDVNVVKSALKEAKLFPFERKALQECTDIVGNYTRDDANHTTNKKKLRPLYDFFRKREMLNYPFTFGNNVNLSGKGNNPVNDENIAYLRNYLLNGGFLFLDDPADISATGHRYCRKFIGSLTESTDDAEEKKILAATASKLRAKDKDVSGFLIGQNTPNPFNADTYISFAVPRVSDVVFRFYNRVGKLVRTIKLDNVAPGRYTSKLPGRSQAVKWDCLDDGGQPVESGIYYVQMESGLFQKTNAIEYSSLRKLDPSTHPLFSSFYAMKGVPVCDVIKTDEAGWISSKEGKERDYGTAAFGWATGERTAIIYTEWAAILRSVEGDDNQVRKKSARQFFTNVLVYALGQGGGVASRM